MRNPQTKRTHWNLYWTRVSGVIKSNFTFYWIIMNRLEKLKLINEVIADKTLSIGCIVEVSWRHTTKVSWWKNHLLWKNWSVFFDPMNWTWTQPYSIARTHKVIWHPVMIGDVLDWVYSSYKRSASERIYFDILWRWHDCFSWWLGVEVMVTMERRRYKRKPIEEQTDECIDFIISLIPDDTNTT